MRKPSLDAMARQLGERAARASSGRAGETVYGGHEKALRQTIVAMTAGTEMGEHENPGDATLLVINGRLRLTAGDVSWDGRQGDLLIVPDERHGVQAVTDTTFLLTVAKH